MPTDDTRDPRIVEAVSTVARSIKFAKNEDEPLGRVVFLIGAGCSVSAGIPDVKKIAQRMVVEAARRLHDLAKDASPMEGYRALVQNGDLTDRGKNKALDAQTVEDVEWHLVYDEMFSLHYSTPDDPRKLFGRIMDETEGAVNWAHLCLGELVARHWVSTVLTTNFDQLVLAGMVHAGMLPVICDGIESLDRIAPHPRYPQLVELHGSRHAYRLRNRPDEVEIVRHIPGAIEAVRGLMHEANTFVVVGYGARENGFMDLLVEAATAYPDKNLYWVQYSNQMSELSAKAKNFLATSRNGGVLLGRDADVFFLDLCRELKIGAPSIVSRPLGPTTAVIEKLGKSKVDHPDIRAEIDEATRRIAAANECLDRASETRADPVVRLRELRLSGKIAEAYRESLVSVPEDGDLAAIDSDLLWEAATIATAFAERDAEIASPRRAERLWRALAARDLAPNRRLEAERRWGWALFRLGERSAETETLRESIVVLTRVVACIDCGAAPRDWVAAQHGLGAALLRLGERESGPERLEAAAATYRAALRKLTRELAPLDWATTQSNLGIALQRLGEREDGPERLEAAVEAFRAALQERTRDRVPLDWAATQNNLGNALSSLGRRESGTERLKAAVEAYHAALQEWPRERVPLDWGMTQNNLGSALLNLGRRESGTERLEAAAQAHRAALQEWTRERVPLDWAATQYNLGLALIELGTRTGDRSVWAEAEVALRAALEVVTPEADGYRHRHVSTALDRVVALQKAPTVAKPKRKPRPPRNP